MAARTQDRALRTVSLTRVGLLAILRIAAALRRDQRRYSWKSTRASHFPPHGTSGALPGSLGPLPPGQFNPVGPRSARAHGLASGPSLGVGGPRRPVFKTGARRGEDPEGGSERRESGTDHPLGRSDRDGIWEDRRFLADLWASGKTRSGCGGRGSRPTPGFLGVSGDHRAEGLDLICIRSWPIREFPRSLLDPGLRPADQILDDRRDTVEIPMPRSPGGRSDR